MKNNSILNFRHWTNLFCQPLFYFGPWIQKGPHFIKKCFPLKYCQIILNGLLALHLWNYCTYCLPPTSRGQVLYILTSVWVLRTLNAGRNSHFWNSNFVAQVFSHSTHVQTRTGLVLKFLFIFYFGITADMIPNLWFFQDYQTLGEEYAGILQVNFEEKNIPSKVTRLLSIFLHCYGFLFSSFLIKRLETILGTSINYVTHEGEGKERGGAARGDVDGISRYYDLTNWCNSFFIMSCCY